MHFVIKFLPFFIFIFLFKISASLHYSLLSPLGEKFFPVWVVGILISLVTFAQLLLDVTAGKLLDKYGYKKLLLLGNIFFLLTITVFFLGINTITFCVSLLLSILGWIFFSPGVNAYLLSQTNFNAGGRVMSIRDISASIAVVITGASLIYVLNISDFFIALILFIPMIISTLILYFFVPREKNKIHEVEIEIENKHYHIKRSPLLDVLKIIKKLNPASTMLVLTRTASSVFYSIIWFIFPLEIAKNIHNNLPLFGLGIFDFAIVLLGFLLGKLADKYNKVKLIFGGLLLFSIAGVLIGFNLNILFLLFGFLATTGDEMASITLWSWLHKLDKDHANDGLVAGIITFAEDFGWTIGPLLAGFLYFYFGATYTILIGGLIVFLVFIIYNLIMLKNKNLKLKHPDAIVPRHPHKKLFKH